MEHVEQESAEPLPKVSYHTLKERRIREMLMEYDLPTNGDKDALASRHQRYAHQCDPYYLLLYAV